MNIDQLEHRFQLVYSSDDQAYFCGILLGVSETYRTYRFSDEQPEMTFYNILLSDGRIVERPFCPCTIEGISMNIRRL